MKKQFIPLLAFSIAIASCSDELERTSANQGDRVGFSLDENTAITRATADTETPTNWEVIDSISNGGKEIYIAEIEDNDTPTFAELTAEAPETRAVSSKRGVEGNFTVAGFRGTTATTIEYSSAWFASKSSKTGELSTTELWDLQKPNAKFYAIYPEATSANNISNLQYSTTDGAPSFKFTVKNKVTDQVSLMTASATDVYTTKGNAPKTTLSFKNALASIRFKIGGDLESNHTITQIQITGVKNAGTYDMSTGTWSNLSGNTTITLTPSSAISTTGTSGKLLTGSDATTAEYEADNTVDDNYTFMMIPQEFGASSNAQVILTMRNASNKQYTIKFKLAGRKWTANRNTNYLISDDYANGTSVFEIYNASNARINNGSLTAIAYDETQTANYYIRSYRTSTGGKVSPLAWSVEKYEEFDGASGKSASNAADWTDLGANAPDWFVAGSSHVSGNGISVTSTGIANYEGGLATLKEGEVIDKMKEYNDDLKNATPAVNLDLSLIDQRTRATRPSGRSTANSYIISAPGTYKIPLVYGNAITNGNTNTSAYHSTAAAASTTFMANFVDHTGTAIYTGNNTNDPWITKRYTVNGAELVWEDVQGIIKQSTLSIENGGAGSTNSFLTFEVDADKIKQGNAVIAVKSGNTVVWSWHLWFAKGEELATKAVTTHAAVAPPQTTYNMTVRNLGYFEKDESTTYTQPRQVRITFKQVSTGKTASVTITQNNYAIRGMWDAKFQWGRKDAFPGGPTTADGDQTAIAYNASGTTFAHNTGNYAGDKTGVGQTIVNPEKMNNNRTTNFYNLWSADNTVTTVNNNAVVKTIYDPSPAGYKLPASCAFTGFTTTGGNSTNRAQWNATAEDIAYAKSGWMYGANRTRNNGYNFYTNSSKNETLFFPASGYRDYSYGTVNHVQSDGYVWSAGPANTGYGCRLSLLSSSVYPQFGSYRHFGYSFRPVSE